jgi:prepilin-type N-terminal cleavage/methylation domain-containing protein
MQAKKGFTLIELLVVLAIVAILSVVVILTLNPAELLKQARDSNRLSDLGTMKSAISLYLADVSTVNLGTTTWCYLSLSTQSASSSKCGVFSYAGTASNTTTSAVANLRKIDGTGWIPVNFSLISSGAPIGNLPIDPINSATLYYAYAATSTNNGFEIDTFLESTKYGGATGLQTTDGGDYNTSNGAYESGTALNI